MKLEQDRLELCDDIDYNMVKSTLAFHLAHKYGTANENGGICHYSDVSDYLKIQFGINIEPISTAMANLLGDISESEFNKGDPLLSVVVVNKETKTPGDGFFKLAKDLGLFNGSLKNKAEKDAFFIAELKRVHEFWSREFDPEYEEYLRLKQKFEGR